MSIIFKDPPIDFRIPKSVCDFVCLSVSLSVCLSVHEPSRWMSEPPRPTIRTVHATFSDSHTINIRWCVNVSLLSTFIL